MPEPEAVSTNPFSSRAVRPGAMAYLFPDGTTSRQLVERLAAHEWLGQIIGPHGSGKSALLASLRPAIEAAGRRVVQFTLHDGERRMPAEFREVKDAANSVVIVVDGYEQLGRLSRWHLRRRYRKESWGLLVTTHRDLGLPTILQTVATPELAIALVNQLQSSGPQLVSADDVRAAFARNAGNLRLVLMELYDQYERRRR